MTKKRLHWLVPALFMLTAIWPLFMHLDDLSVRIWDESRLGINVLEMLRNGNWLVSHYGGAPDMWNTKPPLLLWIQAMFFSVLGHGTLALRLPSAIAAFLTGWFLLRATTLRLGAPWLGLIACLMLYTSDGYMHWHVARSGDYDALVTLFMAVAAWTLFRWSQQGRSLDLFFFFLLLTAGVMTKSVQAILFVPGLLVFLALRRRLIPLLRDRMTWIGTLFMVTVLGAYYLGREHCNPGFLHAVWENELGGRYGTPPGKPLAALGLLSGHADRPPLHPMVDLGTLRYRHRTGPP